MDTAALVLRYVAHQQSTGRWGQKRAGSGRRTLLRFASSCPDRPSSIRSKHIERFVYRGELAPGTRAQRHTLIIGFFRWCVTRKFLNHNPSTVVERPRVPELAPRNLAHDDARAIAAHADGPRERVIVLMMLQEGLRCIEIARAETGDIDLTRQSMQVRGKGGQGAVNRHVALSTETVAAMRAYIDEVGDYAGPFIRSERHPTSGIGEGHISRMMTRLFWRAGVKRAIGDGRSAHACRHTMCVEMIDNGAHPIQVQRAAGHKSLQTTDRYLKGVTPDLREAMGGRSYLDDDCA